MIVDPTPARKAFMDLGCCSQAVLRAGLELDGIESEITVKAAGGLCGGMEMGYVCGALSGAICAIGALVSEDDRAEIVKDIAEWFEEVYGKQYGSINCIDISHEDDAIREKICPGIVEDTYVKLVEVLAAHGYEYD